MLRDPIGASTSAKTRTMAAEREALVPRSSSKKRRLEVSIEHVPSTNSSIAPYAAFFPAGLPEIPHHPSQNGGARNSDDGIAFEAYRSEAMFRGKHQVLVGRGKGIDYVGTNFPIKQGSHYAIGLFNKAEGTLQLAAVAGDKVRSLLHFEYLCVK